MDPRRILIVTGATALPLLAGLALAFFIGAAQAQPVAGGAFLTDPAGRTLYTFDEDAAGKSSCSGACAFAWPPYLAAEGATPSAAFTLVVRDDGAKQWAIDGKPLYRYVGDFKAGDVRGDGSHGTWHLVKAGAKISSRAPARGAGDGYAY